MGDSARVSPLASRLRELRERAAVPNRITQADVAAALGVTPQQVSNWESRRAPQVPPEERLVAYARLFSSARGLGARPPTLAGDDELGEDERSLESTLLAELIGLRADAVGDGPGAGPEPDGFWRFPGGRRILIIASRRPAADREPAPSTDHRNPDYSVFHTYADADAVVEVFGRISAENPASEVSIVAHDAVPEGSYGEHLVVVGSREVNAFADWFSAEMALPVIAEIPAEVTGDARDGRSSRGRRVLVRADSESVKRRLPVALPDEREDVDGVEHVVYRPEAKTWVAPPARRGGPEGTARAPSVPRLYRDVAVIARQPNPLNEESTVTLLYGLHARGTFGAARVFVDPSLRAQNGRYLSRRLASSRRFWLLLSVVCDRGTPRPIDVTPALADDTSRLLEWYG